VAVSRGNVAAECACDVGREYVPSVDDEEYPNAQIFWHFAPTVKSGLLIVAKSREAVVRLRKSSDGFINGKRAEFVPVRSDPEYSRPFVCTGGVPKPGYRQRDSEDR
jgi:hypothetical protein